MPGKDRERGFEKALARHLLANPASEVDAGYGACADAEILAAYHERMLAPEQLTSWKEHIALCPRCQEILAQLEATDELPVGATEGDEAQKVVPMMARSEAPVPAAEQTVGQAVATSATVRAVPAPREIVHSQRGLKWRWIAPAGAIAAGLLVWIAIRLNHEATFELAKNQASQPAASAPPPALQPPPPQKQNEADAPKSADSNSPLTAQNDFRHAASESKAVPQDNSRAVLKQKAVGAPAGNKKTNFDRGLLADKSASVSRHEQSDLNALSAGVENRLEDRKDAAEFANRAAPPRVLAPAPPESAVGAVAGAMAGSRKREKSARDEALEGAKKEAPGAAAQSLEIQSETQAINGRAQPQLMRLARGQTLAVISAPDGKNIWRVGPAGVVEHSTNAGSVWKLQKTGVVADLVTGFAPSDEVCWIVGRSGTILLTTDRGAHWTKLQPPVEDDFATVFAVDSQQATISTASARKTYRTTDGGLTWTLVTDP